MIAAIDAAGGLLARGTLVHSYPHSWRSKAPLIFRNTPQWFISMETNGLREKALTAIDETRWVPPQGRNRIEAMVESRPDWCVSRQRAWGVPIAVFTHRETGEPLRDPAVVERIAAAVEQEGADVWFSADAARVSRQCLRPGRVGTRSPTSSRCGSNSGSTHAFVLEQRPELRWPASLYLEGSDQHRGWFHSSLLEACGTRGRAPYDAVLTHGFVLDEQGRKMSKSLGNVIRPAADHAAERRRHPAPLGGRLRLFRGSPHRPGDPEAPQRRLSPVAQHAALSAGCARRLSDRDEAVGVEAMPELERWVLHRLAELDGSSGVRSRRFDFHGMFTALHNFCAVDLSAFYFDIRKDRLYCDAPDDRRRRAVRTVLDRCFDCLVRWLAPVICFTAEEAWLARHGDVPGRSVHLELFADVPADWRDDALGERWAASARSAPRRHRRAGARARRKAAGVEPAGRGRAVSSPKRLADRLRDIDLAELCITSAGTVRVGPAPGRRLHASRCRRRSGFGCRRRRGSAASAAGGYCPRSAKCRATPISAGAAPTSSIAGRESAAGAG